MVPNTRRQRGKHKALPRMTPRPLRYQECASYRRTESAILANLHSLQDSHCRENEALCLTPSKIEISCVTCSWPNTPSTPRVLKSMNGVSYNRDGLSHPLWVR